MDAASTATTLNAGRVAVGVAFLLAPTKVGRSWFGEAAGTPGGRLAVRTFAIREIALGAATVGTVRATGTGGTGFRVLAGLGLAVDLVDTAATLAAWRALPATGRATVGIAAAAAAAGVSMLAAGD
jgi:hypothetical protein